MNFPHDTYSALRERQSVIAAIPQSMPPSFHNDPVVYKTEVEQIFLTSWICVGRACLAENFMEGYHLTPVHRKTLHPMTPTRLCKKIPGGSGYTG